MFGEGNDTFLVLDATLDFEVCAEATTGPELGFQDVMGYGLETIRKGKEDSRSRLLPGTLEIIGRKLSVALTAVLEHARGIPVSTWFTTLLAAHTFGPAAVCKAVTHTSSYPEYEELNGEYHCRCAIMRS